MMEHMVHQRSDGESQDALQLLLSVAQRQLDSTAILHGDEHCSYRQLLSHVDSYCQELRALGVVPGDVVGVFERKTPAMVAKVLALLKLGVTYLPLDAQLPVERVRFMLEDSGAKFYFANAAHPALNATARHIGGSTGPRPDADRETSAAVSLQRAYIIYTSGSTGKPKGVLIRRSSLTHFLHWVKSFYTKREMTVVAAATSIGFDLSIFELLGTLALGGTVVLFDNVLQLLDSPHRQRITLLNTVPSAMRGLISYGRDWPSLTTINLAGEALDLPLCQQVFLAFGHVRLVNLYGPTEDTTYSMFYEVPPEQTETPPIGRPLPGTAVEIVDEALQPVPTGSKGEICLSGEGLAEGYINRDELTRDRFVTVQRDGRQVRMYRTGDLGAWRADGQVMYHGRADHQVKVRGHRVELGEVEQVLKQVPGIANAAVLATSADDDVQLTAYLAVDPAHEVDVAAVRRFLRQHLPPYMEPRHFKVSSELPLNLNGKVDRRLLASMSTTPLVGPIPSERNGGMLQQAIALFQAVLGTSDIDADTDFFEAGGNSLSALRLSVESRRLTHSISLRLIHDARTPSGIVAAIEGAPPKTDAPASVSGQPFALTPFQTAVMRERHRYDDLDRLVEASVYRLREATLVTRFEEACNAIYQKYDALRTQLVAALHGWQQQVLLARSLQVSHYHQAGTDGRLEVLREIVEAERRKISLLDGRVFQPFAVHFPDEVCVGFVAHHFGSDDYTRLLIEDDLDAYLSPGRAFLPSAPSVAAYVRSIERYLASADAQEEWKYWSSLTPRPAPLPFDATDRPSEVTAASEELSDEITAKTLHALYSGGDARALFAAALVHAFEVRGPSIPLAFKWTHHGRQPALDDSDFSGTAGWLTRHLPVVVTNHCGFTGTALVAHVKAQIDAIPREGLGIQYIYEPNRVPDDPFFYLQQHMRGLALWQGDSLQGDIYVNFFGHADFEATRLTCLQKLDVSSEPYNPRPPLNVHFSLHVNAHRRLVVSVRYDRKYYTDDRMQSLVRAFTKFLHDHATHAKEFESCAASAEL